MKDSVVAVIEGIGSCAGQEQIGEAVVVLAANRHADDVTQVPAQQTHGLCAIFPFAIGVAQQAWSKRGGVFFMEGRAAPLVKKMSSSPSLS